MGASSVRVVLLKCHWFESQILDVQMSCSEGSIGRASWEQKAQGEDACKTVGNFKMRVCWKTHSVLRSGSGGRSLSKTHEAKMLKKQLER